MAKKKEKKEVNKMVDERIGNYSFTIGVVIALILGLASAYITGTAASVLVSILIILGLVVGFLNVTGKETKEFLLVAAVLAVVLSMTSVSANIGGVMYLGPYIKGVVDYILVFIVPAVLIVGLKDIIRIAKP
ncbi:MAG: hypothetical protein KAU20_01090 [Nanoarchaeota archaeon]|nr:hypothetical protein [Nanoarchaeota archaeon]